MVKHTGLHLEGEVFFALCKTIDTPVSLGAWLRFKFNQLALAEMEINPSDYLDSDSFQADYLVVSFLSKWKGLSTGLDLAAEAMKRFISSEVQCKDSNTRIRAGRRSGHARFEQAFWLARRKISHLLGPCSLFKIEPGFGWGPGATDDIYRRAAYVDTKICQTPISCTPTAESLILSVIGLDRHWSSAIENHHDKGDAITVHVDCNVIDTVPKNAKTHRVIAKEPRANGFLQKGVGSYIRKQLKHVGVDLDDQTINQIGAFRAYFDGFATLDLKAASDTVCTELIYELLPIDWAMLLDDLRSRKSLLPDGTKILSEKFSSMGNGFTFELESLIFWSLGSALLDLADLGDDREKTLLVYGDDLIINREVAPSFIELLNYAGFTVNTAKSYVDGNFFESCGKHYFMGVDVTPVYQKDVVVDVLTNIRLSNRLLRYAGRKTGVSKVVLPAWRVSYRSNPMWKWLQIPFPTEGDDGWLMPASEFTAVRFDVNFGFRCNILRVVPLPLPGMERALLAHTLRKTHERKLPHGPCGLAFPSNFDEPYLGDVMKPAKIASHGYRWVMPTGEFDLN